MSLTLDYLKLHEEYSLKYGDKTVVLMQVGTFYECYSLRSSESSKNERGPDLSILSPLLNLVQTRKDKSISTIDEKNPGLIGFPCISIQKNLRMLIDNGWTVVVVDQTSNPPNPKREVTGVYSPSTYIEDVRDDTNYLLSVYITEEKQRNGKVLDCIGISAIDLNIGRVLVNEYFGSLSDEKIAINNLNEYITKINPKEILLYVEKQSFDYDTLIPSKRLKKLPQIDKAFHKVSYQEKFFEKIYGNISMINILQYLELDRRPYGSLSLLLGLDYTYRQNETLLKRLNKPVFIDDVKLVMGNNTLINLDVVGNDERNNLKYNSLFDVVNHTSTVLGKRLLKERLLNPEIDHKIIQKRLEDIEEYLKGEKYLQIQKYLKDIRDISRFIRRMIIKNLHPYELYHLYISLQNCSEIFKILSKNEKDLLDICGWIEKRMDLSLLQKVHLKDLQNFYLPGVHSQIDTILQKKDHGANLIDRLVKTLNGIVKEDLKFTIKNNKKEGESLNLTKKRGDKLKQFLAHWEKIEISEGVEIDVKDLKFSETKTTTKIKVPQLSDNHTDANTIQLMISNKIKEIYSKDLEELIKEYKPILDYTSEYISEIDCIVSNCLTAKKWNYCKPEINKEDSSFVQFTELRHPIIERLIDFEYIPQSLTIGKEEKGILLYGLNSSGKSSFQKSVGLSIILAQAGMYVPARSFSFSPYNSIFTRIDGNDNLFRGLSSFTLEMMDLKNILKYASPNTLIIGDEVCKGTEYLSANSILASTIITLAKRDSSFIFATHLHDIPKLEKIKELNNVKTYHLEVRHDPEKNELVFERLLKEGQGEEIYGMLVAHDIIQDSTFNELVNSLKNEILKHPNNVVRNKSSNYNSEVWVDECEICRRKSVGKGSFHTHHINFQKDCEGSFVKEKPHIPKDGKMNLVVLCEECHEKLHQGGMKIEGFVQTSKGKKVR